MPEDWRSRRRAATNRRIYEVAMDLFEGRGFDQVSVGEIAAAAGVSVPTFYAHFPSKDRIVLRPDDEERIVEAVQAASPGDSVAERVEEVFRTWLTAFDGDARDELLRQWQLVGRTRTLQLRAAEIERATSTVVIGQLQDTRSDRNALAVQLTVFALSAAGTQILMRWAAEDGRRSLGEVCDFVFGTWRSLGTDTP